MTDAELFAIEIAKITGLALRENEEFVRVEQLANLLKEYFNVDVSL